MKEVFEQIYQNPGALWTRNEPPELLQKWIKQIPKGTALDIGCGEGMYAIWLARQGFEVTGIDFSSKAIGHAQQNAKAAGVEVNLQVLDVANLYKAGNCFSLAFEYGVMHHLPHPKTQVDLVSQVLLPKGNYIFATFDPSSLAYGEPGQKVRHTALGTTLYYHSVEEIKNALEDAFTIVDHQKITMVGKNAQHTGNAFWCSRR